MVPMRRVRHSLRTARCMIRRLGSIHWIWPCLLRTEEPQFLLGSRGKARKISVREGRCFWSRGRPTRPQRRLSGHATMSQCPAHHMQSGLALLASLPLCPGLRRRFPRADTRSDFSTASMTSSEDLGASASLAFCMLLAPPIEPTLFSIRDGPQAA